MLSMTGYGESRLKDERLAVSAEFRAVNHRHFKFSARISEPYSVYEPEIERKVREVAHRGTIQLALRIERPRQADQYSLNLVALESYRAQARAWLGDQPFDPSVLFSLPGVVEDQERAHAEDRDDWPRIAAVVARALEAFQQSRQREGQAMAQSLAQLSQAMRTHVNHIEARRGDVIESYRFRLTERVQALVQNQGVTIEPRDLIREVAIFAERSDVAEELTRLKAHLDQFDGLLAEDSSVGRKIEFVVQEMGREANTLGAKVNDVALSREVFEIKGLLESIRELILNIE